ncbi:methyltransferase family protein [Microbacterium sp.]|uniref:methyltransferase family protein n=1 Tax=Microbacterium sp. TaxID=51671 RepID=UPI0039E64344
MTKTPLPPPVWAAATAAAQLVIVRRRRATTASATAASLLAGAAGAVAFAAVSEFAHARTTIDPEHPDRASALVTGGPFRFTRNPMYVALTGLLVAHAVYRRSWWALLPAVGFVAVIDRMQIPSEEAALRARFGRRYDRYRSRVPRWLG